MTTNKISYNVLFACSELTPLVKTGGLADVCGSLPHALKSAGDDVRIVLPAYKSVLQQIESPVFKYMLDLPLGPAAVCSTMFGEIELLLICHPAFSNRTGNPYMSDDDTTWTDNPFRFALFSQAVVEIALNRCDLGWNPDVVHCHDWQTGLVPALLSLHHPRPATVFTIHNLAYQGNITQNLYTDLQLPAALYHPNGLEFWGQASFIKGGLAYADRVNTVSPGYADEIKTSEFGNGMEGLLSSRGDRVSGILNGIDKDWNPQTDCLLPKNYSIETVADKKHNKSALQKEMGLPIDDAPLLFGVISRLAEQKGIDIVIDAIDKTAKENIQLVVLGAGESDLQTKLFALEKKYHNKVAIRIGYNEALSRLIEAGSDVFLMPSRYEPCGLNQMYSLRYGTLPMVTRVGGLADTVTNFNVNDDSGNGFVITEATAQELQNGIKRSLSLFKDKALWRKIQINGMSACFSWDESGIHYRELFAKAMADAARVNRQIAAAKADGPDYSKQAN